MLMEHDGLGAAIAANRICYESASQFNREFKRYFGNTPIEEAQHVRKMLGIHAMGNAFAL